MYSKERSSETMRKNTEADLHAKNVRQKSRIHEMIIKNCLALRNKFNKPMKTTAKIALGVVQKLKSQVMGDHKTYVKEITSMGESLHNEGHGCEIIWYNIINIK